MSGFVFSLAEGCTRVCGGLTLKSLLPRYTCKLASWLASILLRFDSRLPTLSLPALIVSLFEGVTVRGSCLLFSWTGEHPHAKDKTKAKHARSASHWPILV